MIQLELDPKMKAVLDRVRHSSKVLSIYEMPSDLAETAVWEIGKVLLDPQNLPIVQYNTYRWYLRELAKLLRTKTGWDLGLELELCLRKWVGFCLDPAMLQALMRECCDRIGSMTPEEVEEGGDSTTKAPRHEEATHKKRITADDADGRADSQERTSADCVPAPGMGEGLPRRHERHEEDSDSVTRPLESLTPGILPPANNERCTMNESAAPGGGNG